MDEEVDGILLVAHELKAPFAVIRQLAFALDGLEVENEYIRAKMISVSDRAIKQVNDLIKVRRLEDGLFAMEPVAVRAVCDDVILELGSLFQKNQRRVSIRYKNRARLAVANRELLYSIVYNFLLNAMHYSDDKTQTKMVVSDARGKIRVTIRDYGPALPVNIWRQIRMGQVEKPTSVVMRPGSSGLGLYIASKFSKYMNAEIGAIRHKDGTSFYVEIPISRQASLF